MTMRENFLKLMRNENPKWVGDPWSCFNENPRFRPCLFDAVTESMGKPARGERFVTDAWGVVWDFAANEPGPTPYLTEENKVIKDITEWKSYVKFPDISNLDWSKAEATAASADRENLLVMCPTFSGLFEFSHYMMGFEDALCNYLIEPDYMYELLEAYTDWKIKAVGMVIEHMKPDIMHSHDDWGSKYALFLSPEVWRKIIKPHYQKFYGFIKSKGVIVMHHSDSFAEPIAQDMVDVGIDIWQGALPQNNIKKIIEDTKGKLCILGGIDMQKIDLPIHSEEEIRSEVRRAIDEYVPLGSFIPCVTNVIPVHKEVEKILNDELTKYGAIFAEKYFA